jgi:hypothetical protein
MRHGTRRRLIERGESRSRSLGADRVLGHPEINALTLSDVGFLRDTRVDESVSGFVGESID